MTFLRKGSENLKEAGTGENWDKCPPDMAGQEHSWIPGICGFLNKSNPISILAWRTRSPRDPPLRSYWQMMKTGKWPHVTGEPMAHKYSSSSKQPSQVTRINKQTNDKVGMWAEVKVDLGVVKGYMGSKYIVCMCETLKLINKIRYFKKIPRRNNEKPLGNMDVETGVSLRLQGSFSNHDNQEKSTKRSPAEVSASSTFISWHPHSQ